MESVDMLWVMLGTILVFFMHAGFSMVETGFTRSKNSLNILMKNFLTISLGAILYFVVGYGIMFGADAFGFLGTDGFMLSGVEDIGFFIFQAMFAATCATIISGAVAERVKLNSYLLLTVAMTAFIYPVVGHWVWGGGWLSELGFVDFAGSTVVHFTGAVGAIAAVMLLGARIGKYSEDGKSKVIPASNVPLGALGVFFLWFGWFGFNGGSALAADVTVVPHVISTTMLSASAAVVVSAFYSSLKYKKIDASLTLNGALGGLVGITAGTADVSLTGSIIIGFVSGIVLVEGVAFVDRNLRLDDPVGAIAVHGACGIWGTIAVGLFATEGGLFYGGGATLLGVQALGVIATFAWTFVVTLVFFGIIKAIAGVRVTEEEEISGLDFAEHGSQAYELKDIMVTSPAKQSNADSTGSSLIERLNHLHGKSAKTD
ncbi:ammonium transporter, Amt family [Salinibacillus kushneri]|uniref:Ammonium transporter n=1 Tax=Salinibacillus kushneri TaxID=237682 RepID=A0A1I0JFN9_9BACI|nr:ammonium transporter [Salinibacillus kushneri]SEU08921.1 ammonium transporter, Amt family [Salinibacillus kushneri]